MPFISLTDANDPRLALYRGVADPALLSRHAVFIAEGRLVVERLVTSGRYVVRSVLVNEAARHALVASLGSRLDGLDVFVVPNRLVGVVSGHHVHRGALALAERPRGIPFAQWWSALRVGPDARAHTLVATEAVSNPDNIGGLFRNAAAFGCAGVLLDPASSDPLYRKAIRTAMGATLDLPWVRAKPWPDALSLCAASGVAVVALTRHPDAASLREVAASLGATPVVVLVGSEGQGLSAAALGHATHRARIPMAPGCDSLNVAVAAGIALFELAGRR